MNRPIFNILRAPDSSPFFISHLGDSGTNMRPNRKHKDGRLSVASIKRQLLIPVSNRIQFDKYENNIPTTIAY